MVAGICAGVAIAAKGDPQKRPTPADQAKARAVVLRQADLPAAPWKAEQSSGNDSGRPQCRTYHPDFSDLVRTGRFSGLEFTAANTIFVSSDASVYAGRDAEAAWSRVVTPKLVACIGEVVRKAFGKPPAARLIASVRRPFPQVTQRAAAYRVTVGVRSQGQTVRAYVDLVLLKHGRVASDLTIIRLGQPFPDAELRRLAALMGKRMR
jgi:hypothetical protein